MPGFPGSFDFDRFSGPAAEGEHFPNVHPAAEGDERFLVVEYHLPAADPLVVLKVEVKVG